MNRYRLSRRVSGATVTLLFISGLMAGTAVAKPLDLTGTATAVPGTVSPDSYVRFDVQATNPSSSNISQLTMATETASTLVGVVAGPSQGTCDDSGAVLTCDFGALPFNQTVTFSVVYVTPTSGSGNVNFNFTSTGSTGQDKGKNSHGDARTVVGAVTINASSDFGGRYLFDPEQLTVADDLNVSRRNPQATQATSNQANVPLTVGEVSANTFACPGVSSASCFGQWSVVNLNNGAIVADGFEVVIVYDRVHGNANAVNFVHLVGSDLHPTFITESCSSAIPVNCIADVESKQGATFFTLIVDNNGPMRGY